VVFSYTLCTSKIYAHATFSVVNKFLLKGKKFVYLIAIRIKLMTVLADFKTQDFQRASSYGKLALLTVSSCKGTALKRTAQNNC
jgi:hypothetical protein